MTNNFLTFVYKLSDMNVAELKIKIFRQVDSLEPSKLEEFYGIMLNYLNSKKEIDEWIGVTNLEKQGIEEAIQELDSGKGIPYNQVMSKFRKNIQIPNSVI